MILSSQMRAWTARQMPYLSTCSPRCCSILTCPPYLPRLSQRSGILAMRCPCTSFQTSWYWLTGMVQAACYTVLHRCMLKFARCTADEGSDSPSDAMFEHLCATLLQQSHLCPVPLEAQPVFWNYDHALHLYPIPDVLVLADRAPCASFGFPAMPADQIDQSCICLNPVTFSALLWVTVLLLAAPHSILNICELAERPTPTSAFLACSSKTSGSVLFTSSCEEPSGP